MPVPKVGKVPFNEAINFLQGKLQIPTEHWQQLDGASYAKGFTISGAIKADLLNDFYHSILAIRKQGGTIHDFRKDFDYIVEKYGWKYKGKRGWRTRVIYNTNMRTASMAGRWQQLQRTKKSKPFIQYITVGDENVRASHQVWDGTILPVDHPFWDTHYPPNGWGCRCTIRSYSQSQLERRGLKVSPNPKPNINKQTKLPDGIDVGWDYNVGKAWLAPDIALGQKLLSLPPKLRDQALRNVSKLTTHLQKDFDFWINSNRYEKKLRGTMKTVGYLAPELINYFNSKSMILSTSVVTLSDQQIPHLSRIKKKKNKPKKEKTISEDLLLNLPSFFIKPEAIIWDKREDIYIYAFSSEQDDFVQKIVFKINFITKGNTSDGKRHKFKTNSIRSGGIVSKLSLSDSSFYEVIYGEL